MCCAFSLRFSESRVQCWAFISSIFCKGLILTLKILMCLVESQSILSCFWYSESRLPFRKACSFCGIKISPWFGFCFGDVCTDCCLVTNNRPLVKTLLAHLYHWASLHSQRACQRVVQLAACKLLENSKKCLWGHSSYDPVIFIATSE